MFICTSLFRLVNIVECNFRITRVQLLIIFLLFVQYFFWSLVIELSLHLITLSILLLHFTFSSPKKNFVHASASVYQLLLHLIHAPWALYSINLFISFSACCFCNFILSLIFSSVQFSSLTVRFLIFAVILWNSKLTLLARSSDKSLHFLIQLSLIYSHQTSALLSCVCRAAFSIISLIASTFSFVNIILLLSFHNPGPLLLSLCSSISRSTMA